VATFIDTTRDGSPLYRVRWNYRDKTIDGKPYDQREFRDLRKAKAWKKQVERAEAPARGGRILVADIADAWLAQHVARLPGKRSRDDAEQTVRMRIKPGLGSKVADRVTPGDGNRWLQSLVDTGYTHLDHTGTIRRPARAASIPTANKALRYMRAMMRWGRGQDMTTCRAFDDVRELRDRRTSGERRTRARAYTADELDLIVASCDTLLDAAAIQLAAATGLRRSELFALCWECIDLEGGYVSVERALDSDGSFKAPKTYEERRVQILDDEALDTLRAWRDAAPNIDIVFSTVDGRTLHTTWDSGHLPGIRKRSGIHVQLGECRDTFASWLIAVGATAEELKMAMGHENVQTTLSHYSEWLRGRTTDLRALVTAARRANRSLARR
jgi:integrase